MKPLTARLLDACSDGQWHHVGEFVSVVGGTVSPEAAMKYYRTFKTDGEYDGEVERMVRYGRQRAIEVRLYQLKAMGCVESDEGTAISRRYRITDTGKARIARNGTH